jgi:hypothetical protein
VGGNFLSGGPQVPHRSNVSSPGYLSIAAEHFRPSLKFVEKEPEIAKQHIANTAMRPIINGR